MIARLLSSRYRSASPFAVTTADGVPLTGARLGEGPASLVLCHGFMGWHRKSRIVSFAERMADRFIVYVFDLRGHGASAGLCTYGDRECLDVDAVVGLARRDAGLPVATLGASMGGIAVIRQAAMGEPPDAVMAVSTPARWEGHGTVPVRRITRMSSTRSGRRMMRALGFRLTDTWASPEDPERLVEKVAPTPLVIVHGRDDHFFDEENAWRLYSRAGEPKRLMLASRFGHAEDGFTPVFADLAARRLLEILPT